MTAFSGIFLLFSAPCIGSFLGLLVERLPLHEPVAFSRSRCRSCGVTLGAADLVPILSWALSRGRCRSCGVRLSWFYPAIEVAALGVAAWSLAVAPGWLAWAGAALGWSLLAMSAIDARHMILPDVLTLPLIPAGLAVAALTPGVDVTQHAIGAVVGAGALAAVAAAHKRLTGREGLGLGDVKLFAAAGAWVGWQGLPSVLLIGAGAGLAAALMTSRRGRQPIPFGPFLALGLWITWLYGPLTFYAL